MPNTNYAVVGGAGAGSVPSLNAPAAVTIGTITYQYVLNPNSQYSGSRLQVLELTVPYTKPGAWTGKGVHAYLEYPDQSAATGFSLNGTTALDGTSQIGGEWKVQDLGQFADDGTGAIVLTGISAPSETINLRIYLVAYANNVDPKLVRATATGPSPSAVVTITPPPVFALGEEYAKIVATIGASAFYGQNGSGQEVLFIKVFWTPPADPQFAGVYIRIHRPANLDPRLSGTRTGVLLSQSQDILSGFIPGTQINGEWTTELSSFPTVSENDQITILSSDGTGVNSFVNGFTPSVTITIGPPAIGNVGQERTSVLPSFTASVVYGLSADGVETYGFFGPATMPAADSSFGGYQVYIHNQADGTDHSHDYPITGGLSAIDVTWHTDLWPIQGPQPTWDLYALSYDTNNRQNTFFLTETPEIFGLNPTTQTTGSLKAHRLDPATLDATLAIFSSKLGIPDTSIAIQKFVAGIRPVLVVTSDPALPDSRYPTGTYEFNTTTLIMKRVNAAGTAWEKAINGGVDIQAGTITGDRIVANTITVGLLQVGVLAASNITAGTFVGGVVYAGQINTSQINAGTISVAVTLTAPTIVITSGSVTINIDGTNYILLKDPSTGHVQTQLLSSGLNINSTSTPAKGAFVTFNTFGATNNSGITVATLDATGGYGKLTLNAAGGGTIMSLDASTGYLQSFGQNVIGPRALGWHLPSGTLSRATFDQSTATLADVAQRLAALITDLFQQHGMIGT